MNDMISFSKTKRWKASQLLEQYIFQQRKLNLVIYTNDAEMKLLLGKAYPNITIEVLDIKNFTKEAKDAKT